jgi:branched-chain amino acid transport system ATP-binding protein/nonpolar-amino-acid-transporting ATPase
MTHDQDILVLEQVGHRFGGFTVLRSVTFSVPEGGIVGLIGPNGSGKTTLFNIISGYLALQAGSITYGGRTLTTQSVQDRSRAGMVRTFQTPKIFERMTVLENIMVGACKITRTGILQDLVRSPHARSELRQILMLAERVGEELGLEGNLPAATLTAGQRRILEIARVLVAQPRLLMLDEPSAGLNHEEMRQLIATIERLNDAGLAILLVSHDMVLMAVAETVHVLNFGEIIARGNMAAIQQNADVREVYLGI